MKKRFLSLVLVVLMILAVVPFSAYAADGSIKIDSYEAKNNRIYVDLDPDGSDTTFKVNYTINSASGGTYDVVWSITPQTEKKALSNANGDKSTGIVEDINVNANEPYSDALTVTIPAGTEVPEKCYIRLFLRAANSPKDISYPVKKIEGVLLNGYYVTLNNNDGMYKGDANNNRKIFTHVDKSYGSIAWPAAADYTREGYTFVGFASNEDGTENSLSWNGLKQAKWSKYKITTWYAQWEANDYTVSFVGKANEAVADQKVKYEQEYELSEDVKAELKEYVDSNAGYNGYWVYNGRKYNIDAAHTHDVADNIVVKYSSSPIKYTVRFDADGGEGTMADQQFKYGVPQELNANVFKKAGYTFTGWKLDETEYADGARVNNLTTEDNAIVTLTAKWTPNNYKVVFNANGGSGNMDDVARAYNDKKPLPECDFTREGYTFAGWGKHKDNTPDSATTWQPGQIKNFASIEGSVYILYAIWEPNTCTVNFNANGGEGTMAPQTYTYDEYQTLTLNAFTKTGYDFIGWALTADAAEPNYTDGQNVCNFTTVDGAEVNLYAVWEQIDYTVTLNTNGGTVNSGNVTGYTIETGATLPTDVTKAGYTFEGWYDNAALTGEAVEEIAAGTTGDKAFWAKWTSNDTDVISVVYDGDTASRENDTFKFVRDDRDLPNDGTLFIITLSDSKAKVVEGPESEDGGLTWKFLVESESREHKEYTIKFVIPALHKITVINGTASQDEGFIGNIIDIDADDILGGKQFVYWEVKSEGEVVFIGGKASEITSFIMPDADVTVTAVYRAVLPMFMHSIIVVDSDYGTTSPTGIMLVMQGLSHKFTFTPDAGCEIVDVLINGESVGAVDSYRLTVNDFVNTVEAIYAPVLDGDAE